MKVLQINTVHKEKSTGRTCYEVNKALENHGYEGYVAYGRGRHKEKNAYRIGSELEYYFHNIMSRITGLEGYFSYFATKRLIGFIKKIDPDIIHLRNLHGHYINLPLLFRYLRDKQKPVLLNLHDCWIFTGKCTYYTDLGCNKWKTECGKCPVINQYPKSYWFDFTRRMHKDKRKWLTELENLTIVGVSDWVTNEGRKSFLQGRPSKRIYNWINMEVFKRYDENVLVNYGVDPNKFTIIGVSANWTKGSPRYEDFMKLADMIDESIQIILVGQSNESIKHPNITHIPFVEDTTELAKLYSSANVYVHFSTEDTFGKVIGEAMACGLPAIVYNSTACPELVKDGCGYIVPKRDVKETFRCVLKVKKGLKEDYAQTCIARVASEFNYEKNISELISLYKKVLKNV